MNCGNLAWLGSVRGSRQSFEGLLSRKLTYHPRDIICKRQFYLDHGRTQQSRGKRNVPEDHKADPSLMSSRVCKDASIES